MISRISKIFITAMTLPILTGCAFVNNIIDGIALNLIYGTDFLINRLSLAGGEAELTQYEPRPTTEATRGDLTYGIEALILPKSVEVEQFGFTIKVDFTLEFSEGAADYFYRQDYSPEESGSEIDFAAEVLYPVGSVEKPTNIEDIGTYLSIDRLLDFHAEEARNVEITLKGSAGKKTKEQKFYLNLNNEGITLPGDDDKEIDLDYALVIESTNASKDLEITIPKEDLVAGFEVPLQVMWLELGKSGEQGNLSIEMTDISLAYDVVLPEVELPHIVTVNETLVEYPVLITLKMGLPTPLLDLVVTFTATVSPLV